MRVNIYAEEMTDRVEIVEKDGHTGVRFYLELPVTKKGDDGNVIQHQGPFLHHPGDDDSAAVTFWGKQALRRALQSAIDLLDARHGTKTLVGTRYVLCDLWKSRHVVGVDGKIIKDAT